MEVTSFAAINKFQPFNVAISSNVLFLLVCALWVRSSPVWAEAGVLWRQMGSLECQLYAGGHLVCLLTVAQSMFG